METIEKIKNIAQEQGISLAHICRKINVARVYFHDIQKSGREIPMDKLIIIADTLHTTVDYLLGNEEPPSSEEPKLSEGEEMLLDLFRRIPEDKQELILQMIRVAVENL